MQSSILLCFVAFAFWGWLQQRGCSAFTAVSPSPSSMRRRHSSRTAAPTVPTALGAKKAQAKDDDNNDDNDEWTTVTDAELVTSSPDTDEDDWLPDRERAKQKRQKARKIQAERITKQQQQPPKKDPTKSERGASTSNPASAYTDEEEQVIAAMGGRKQPSSSRPSKRQPGYLGDCTLQEIATDYSVPICYLADVLTMWGVPPPIPTHDVMLGDLVTGEQAFALVEAVNSLDVAALQDRYSNTNLLQLCAEWDIDLQQAFEMAMKQGWSLPFGVQTCLRVEQEDELIRTLGNNMMSS